VNAAPSLGTDGGLTILDPARTALLNALDGLFTAWGFEAGAVEVSPPPVFPVADLEKFDVYDNFPHLSLVAGALRTDGDHAPRGGRFYPDQVQPAALGLPTATCFGAYLFHEGRRVAPDTVVTLANRCFRGEDHFEGLRRLLSFRMREIVAIGSYEHTQNLVHHHVGRIERLCHTLSLEVTTQAASDPFFEREGARALLQTLEAVKHEFIVDGLAISSVNVHRNFFGERCRITVDGAQDGFAFTSCVAFGLERWVSVLLERHRTPEAALAAVKRAGAELEPA
jgi:hypothetical protein